MMEDQEHNCLKRFLKQLGSYGKHRKVVKLHGKETQASDIIVGEIHSMTDTTEKSNRTLLVTVLREVYPDGSKGKLFSLFAFDKYAHIMKSNSGTGSIIGICGADIDKSPIIDKNDSDHLPYRARLGLPKKNGSKFVFMKNCHSKENEILPKMLRLNNSPLSQTKKNLSKSLQITSKEGSNTAAGASKPKQNTSKTSSKTSKVAEDINLSVPSTSKTFTSKSILSLSEFSAASSTSTAKMDIPEKRQTQKLAVTVNRYQYSKLCDMKTAATRLNLYGVINRILRNRDNYAHLDLVDETLPDNQTFKLHVFRGTAPALPNILEGHIIRAHRLKTEEFQEQWDGRVFDARDIVIFPPEGTGKEGAETVSKHFHFEDADLERLTKLRQWIKKEYSKRPKSPVPTSRESGVCGEERDSGAYNSSVKTLAEIQSEGHYILYCKVVESHHKKGKTVLIVTDGTIPSNLIRREETRSVDHRDRIEDSITVKVVLKSETQMKLQHEFVKMIGVEAEMIVDAYSEKSCLAFLLRKIQNIKIIPSSHNQAKRISRRLQQMKKDANRSVSAGSISISKRVPNVLEVESESNSRNGHDVPGSSGLPQNRNRKRNSGSRESENRELETINEETEWAGESTDVQQRRRSLSSEDFLEIKHNHHWHDPQRQFNVKCLEIDTIRDNGNEIQMSTFDTSTPVKNCDVPDGDEEDGKNVDIISLLYNLPEKKNSPTNTQESKPEDVDCLRFPSLLREDRQSSCNDSEIPCSSKQLQKAPLVPRANSKDGSELLKSLKQKARRRVYGDEPSNMDSSLEFSSDTIYDNGVKTIPNQMPNKKSQSQECLECSGLGSAEIMTNVHQCMSRIARVEPVTRDQENLQVKTSSDVESAEEVQQFQNSEEQSSTETEHDTSHQNLDVVDLNEAFSGSEQGDNRSEGDIIVVDDPITPVAGPSVNRERMYQSQALDSNVDSGTSEDEDSGSSSACTYVTQNESILGKRVAESCSDRDVDRHSKYPKASSANSVYDIQNSNNSDDQDSIVSESSISVASRWTEVQDSADENPMPVTIRCIKSRGIEENEYLVEGVITNIEPPIRAGSSKDFVSGYCSSCNTFSRYSSLILEGNSQERTCPHCPRDRRKQVTLVFALRLRIVDQTKEELQVGLCGEGGVDFFGVTVNRYLRDPQIRKQVANALLDLLPAHNARREPKKVRLCIQSFLDLSGMQYMIKKTYLCFTH